MKDKVGFEIPDELIEPWQEADRIGRELCGQVQAIYLQIEKGLAEREVIYAEINQSAVEDLKYIWRCLALIIPYAICPYDQGDPIKRIGCPGCLSKGYVSKFRWTRAIPKNVKAAHLATLAETTV